MTRFFKVFLVTLCLLSLVPSARTQAQSPSAVKNQEEEMRQVMITMSRQLGVTCTTCHDQKNFRSDKKVEYRIAKEHMKITQLLIDNGFDGKRGPKADCYMCHRGDLKPKYKEKVDPILGK